MTAPSMQNTIHSTPGGSLTSCPGHNFKPSNSVQRGFKHLAHACARHKELADGALPAASVQEKVSKKVSTTLQTHHSMAPGRKCDRVATATDRSRASSRLCHLIHPTHTPCWYRCCYCCCLLFMLMAPQLVQPVLSRPTVNTPRQLLQLRLVHTQGR